MKFQTPFLQTAHKIVSIFVIVAMISLYAHAPVLAQENTGSTAETVSTPTQDVSSEQTVQTQQNEDSTNAPVVTEAHETPEIVTENNDLQTPSPSIQQFSNNNNDDDCHKKNKKDDECENNKNHAPTIVLKGDATINVTVGDEYDEPGVRINDQDRGDHVSLSITTNPHGGVRTNSVRTYIITYTATDSHHASASVTRTVNIVAREHHNHAPTITLIGNSTITVTVGGTFTDPGVTASDSDHHDTVTVSSTTNPIGGVNVNVINTYTITYTATDSHEATASVTRTVNVIAAEHVNVAPTISLIGSSTINITLGGDYTELGATATDTEDGDLSGGIIITGGPIATTSLGTTILTYTVTDSGHLSASTTRTITIIPVVITGGGDTSTTTDATATTTDETSTTTEQTNTDSNTTSNVTTSSSSGRSGTFIGGNVLGAFSDRSGQVLGASTSCGLYITKYMSINSKNDTEEVKKLQAFLNEYMGTEIAIDGVFGQDTLSAVKAFQLKHKDQILAPWFKAGLLSNDYTPTGRVYKTTLRLINNIVCSDLNLPIPTLN